MKTIAGRNLNASYDLVVVGSGAGGLSTAAVASSKGLSVLVVEKTDQIGGTSAWSGGWMWIPMNRHARAAGIEDSRQRVQEYLDSVSDNRARGESIEKFLDEGPKMVEFFEDHCGFQFIDGNKVPDFQNVPGALPGGRSLCSAPFDNRKLGRYAKFLRRPLRPMTLFGMAIASFELKYFFDAKKSASSLAYVLKRLARYFAGFLIWHRDVRSVNGNGLVGQLFKQCIDNDVDFVVSTRVREFTPSKTGWNISGFNDQIVEARSLVLAGGGFPHRSDLRKRLFDLSTGTTHYSAALESNEGDLSITAENHGASIADDYLHAGAWSPVSRWEHEGKTINFPHLVDRAKPGILAIGPDGKRFVNEADSYHAFMAALFSAYESEEPHCWLITDHVGFARWGIGAVQPLPGAVNRARSKGYLKVAPTIKDLAAILDLPADDLSESIERFNGFARDGVDADFGRGASLYNRVQGDADHQPNPSLGTVEEGPFYAVKIVSGSLGTFAGLRTNSLGQVVDQKGSAIDGLYAVGNEAASIFQGSYPSGGITLGPAMTFGYVIAKHIKNHIDRKNS